MKSITLRNIPPKVAKLIRDRARGKGLSANRAVLDLLLELAGPKTVRPKQLHHDLDELAGVWGPAEAADFESELSTQRAMDGRLWQ